MAAGYTSVTAAKLRDASGTLVTNATATFTPNYPFRVGTDHGPTVETPVTAAVSNGALSLNLADTSISNPQNVSYRLVIRDNLSGEVLLADGYDQLQPSGASWSLDEYVAPVDGPLALVVAGPVGPQGAAGISSLPQLAAIRAATPQGQGNQNPTSGWSSGYIEATTNIVHSPDPSYQFSPYIPANSGAQMVFSIVTPPGVAGVSFYDQGYAFISGLASSSLAANSPFAIPANSAYLRYSYANSTNAPTTLNLYNGSVLPSSYQAPNSYPTNVTDAQLAALSAQIGGVATLTAIAAVRAATPQGQGNQNPVLGWTSGYITATTGATTSNSSYQYSPFIGANSGGQMVLSILTPAGAAGVSFYDATQAFISGINTSALAAGTPFAVPGNAAYLRYSYAVSVNAPNTLNLYNGAVLPPTYQAPSSYPMNVADSRFATRTSTLYATAASVIYDDGASITAGYTLTSGQNRFMKVLAQSLWASGTTSVGSSAVSGKQTAQMVSDYAAGGHAMSPAVTGNTAPCYFFVGMDAAYNDANNGVSLATSISNLSSLYNSAHADGYKVILLTSPVQATAASPSVLVSQAAAVNKAALNGTIPSDKVVNTTEWAPDQLDSVLYQPDKVHWNAAMHLFAGLKLAENMSNDTRTDNYQPGVHMTPQVCLGGVQLQDSTGARWIVKVSTSGLLSAVAA